MTTIVDWFDPTNKEHLLIYRHVQTQGYLPANSVPPDIERTHMWIRDVTDKLADQYVRMMLDEDID